MTGKQLKMWSRETVRRNRIEPAETENLPNSQKCLITLHIVGWVIIKNVVPGNSSSKPDQTGRKGKCAEQPSNAKIKHYELLFTYLFFIYLLFIYSFIYYSS